MGNEKDARELINENLTDEEMQDLMASYKKELAHVYKMASAKKAALVRRNLPYIKAELEKRPGNERRYRGFETQVWHSLLIGKICKKKICRGD